MIQRFSFSNPTIRGLLFLWVLLIIPNLALSQDSPEEIEADFGIRRIKVEAKSFSKGMAGQQEALKIARLDALSIWMTTQEIRDQRGAFKERITSRFEEYVLSERVLNKVDEFDGTRLEVEVYLDESLLRYDLASILFPLVQPKPKVSFLISENLAGQNTVLINSGDSYTMLKALFEDAQFRSGNESEENIEPTQNELIEFLNQGPAGILRYAKTVRSDIIVTGLVSAKPVDDEESSTPSHVHLLRADAQVQIVRVEDGKVFQLLNGEAELKSTNISDGSRGAARDAVYKIQREALISAVFAILTMPEISNQFRLKIEGAGIGAIWGVLAKQLSRYPGVTHFETIFSRPTLTEAQFTYDGSISSFVEALDGFEYQGFDLEPRMVAGQDMEFKLVVAGDL